jgi:preprotein translocase subunit YajC
MNMLPLAAIFAIFYFLLIRPQQKQQKEHEQMLKDLKKGDKILTAGGHYGTITGFLPNDDLEVQHAHNVKLTVARHAVSRLVSSEADDKAKTAS